MTVAAGQLNRRLTIRRPTAAYNSFNEPIETLGTLATVWAHKADTSAGESYRAQEVGSQITTRFTIRYSATVASVNPVDSLLCEGKAYNITAVREVKRNRMIEIDAVRQQDVQAATA